MTVDDDVVAFLLVASNLIYLFPALLAWYVRYYELFSFLIAVTIISSIHHLCTDGGVCFDDLPPVVFSKLDSSFALIAIGISLLSIVIYELIKMNRMRSLIRDGYTVRNFPMSRYGDKSEYVLVKHTYADLFISFLVVIVIVTVFVLDDNSIMVYVVLGLYITFVWIFHWVLYWPLKVKNRYERYYWPAIVLAAIFAITSIILFKFIEINYGRINHAFWHVTGALTCSALIIGTTAFHVAESPLFY